MATIEKTIEHFIVDRQLKGNTQKTIDNYRQYLGYFTDYIGLHYNVEDITLKQLQEYQIYLTNKDRYNNHIFKPKETGRLEKVTIQSYIRHLRVYIRFLYLEEYITTDLTVKFKLPKAPKKIIDILDDEEIKILLNAFKETSELQLRNKCIIYLLLDCGLRKTEVLNLEYYNISFTNNYLKVNGKGEKERLVPLGLNTKKLLLKYINNRSIPEEKTKLLFIDKNNKPMSDTALKMMFTRLKNKTGLSRLHPHLLRHTFATHYLVKGGDIFSLQIILGHTSLEMVRKYSHLASSYVIANHKRLSPVDEMERNR